MINQPVASPPRSNAEDSEKEKPQQAQSSGRNISVVTKPASHFQSSQTNSAPASDKTRSVSKSSVRVSSIYGSGLGSSPTSSWGSSGFSSGYHKGSNFGGGGGAANIGKGGFKSGMGGNWGKGMGGNWGQGGFGN